MSIGYSEMTPEEIEFYERKAAEALPMSPELIATLRMIFRPAPIADGCRGNP
jgi:hypothetical protein